MSVKGRNLSGLGGEYPLLTSLRSELAELDTAHTPLPVPTVAGRLGHARASTTLNVYSHFVAATDQHAVEVLDTLLQRSGKISP